MNYFEKPFQREVLRYVVFKRNSFVCLSAYAEDKFLVYIEDITQGVSDWYVDLFSAAI